MIANDSDTYLTATNTDFYKAMAELDAQVARFQAAVAECCEAIHQFEANL